MDKFKVLQDELWGFAETGMEEFKSAKAMEDFLENEGYFTYRLYTVLEQGEVYI